MKAELIKRLNQNFNDYIEDVKAESKDTILCMAHEIASTIDAHYYLAETHKFTSMEAGHLLNFRNPLEVVATEWVRLLDDISGMEDAIDSIMEREGNEPGGYALMHDPGRRRFINVELTGFIEAVAGKIVTDRPIYLSDDKKLLFKAAEGNTSESRRLVWKAHPSGTALEAERDIFIKGIGAHASWTDIDANAPGSFAYAIYVDERDGGKLIGSVFELGSGGEHADHVRRSALPVKGVTFEHENGLGYTLGLDDYDLNRDRLTIENGAIISKRYYTSDESALEALLKQERIKRGLLPLETPIDHLQRLTDTLAEIRAEPEEAQPAQAPASDAPASAADHVIAEANRITDEFMKLEGPNSPDKTHFMVKLSPEFMRSAESSKDMERLLAAIPIKNLSLSNLKSGNGKFAFAPKGKGGKLQLKRSKTSVLARLENKPKVCESQPAHTNEIPRKKRDARD